MSVCSLLGGGSQVQVEVGGIPGPGQGGGVEVQVGGSQVQVKVGWGVPGPGRGGGGPRSRSGGVPSLRSGGGVSVKGKNFDTRFGLIHVQTRIIFCRGTPPQ